MKKSVLSLIILLFITIPLYSEEVKKIRGGIAGFTMTAIYNDLSALNRTLKSAGYPALNDISFGIGGGGGVIGNNIYLGGHGFGSFAQEVVNSSNRISYDQRYGYFDCGYLLFNNQYFLVLPFVSIGAGELLFRISPMNITNLRFNNILSSPANSSYIRSGSAAFGANVLLGVKFGYCDIVLGLGYYYLPSDGLKVENIVLLDQPLVGSHSLNVSLTIYFGQFSPVEEENRSNDPINDAYNK